MQPILEIKNISKKFRIRYEQQPYLSLRDSLSGFFKNSLNRLPTTETFWALKDISFDVYPGESIGIIGKNGAGKSTLLKILSKITPPTKGKIISRGRISSLLEVGTGFHPELTGRENVFLNGSILGMKQKEILSKFDQIVDFSGVERFLDTPLKHYSSGMQLRLAFAVAAFLEPEILIIDEVLAVGDAEFQKKCLEKMDQEAKVGRTVLFVSHNMAAVKSLCSRALYIEKGIIEKVGNCDEVIQSYFQQKDIPIDISIAEIPRENIKSLSFEAKIIDFKIQTADNKVGLFINPGQPIKFLLRVLALKNNVRLSAQFVISDEFQNLVMFDSATMHNKIYTLPKGVSEIECDIENLNLYAGDYKIQCALTLPNQGAIDNITDFCTFTIRHFDPNNTGFNLDKNNKFALYYVNHRFKDAVFISSE